MAKLVVLVSTMCCLTMCAGGAQANPFVDACRQAHKSTIQGLKRDFNERYFNEAVRTHECNSSEAKGGFDGFTASGSSKSCSDLDRKTNEYTQAYRYDTKAVLEAQDNFISCLERAKKPDSSVAIRHHEIDKSHVNFEIETPTRNTTDITLTLTGDFKCRNPISPDKEYMSGSLVSWTGPYALHCVRAVANPAAATTATLFLQPIREGTPYRATVFSPQDLLIGKLKAQLAQAAWKEWNRPTNSAATRTPIHGWVGRGEEDLRNRFGEEARKRNLPELAKYNIGMKLAGCATRTTLPTVSAIIAKVNAEKCPTADFVVLADTPPQPVHSFGRRDGCGHAVYDLICIRLPADEQPQTIVELETGEFTVDELRAKIRAFSPQT
jgi:hypothetical protein